MKAISTKGMCVLGLPVLLWIVFAIAPLQAQTPADTGSSDAAADRYVTIDFNNVDITVFIKFISELTAENFVVDDRVKGKVTIISPTKISVDEAYRVFESVLEVYGFAAIKAGDITKIVPAPDARTKNIETLLKQEAQSPDDKIVTQLIPLKYADPDEIKKLFAPLVSKNSVILSYPPSNMLILTDVYSNITRLQRILEAIDITGIGQEISVIPLENADAAKLVTTLTSIFKQQKTKKGAADRVLEIVSDERTNTIVLLANEVDSDRIKALIKMLDQDVPKGKEKIHVYYLEYATAEDLAKVLEALPSKKSGGTAGKKDAPVVSEEVKITADKATNSLIIMAEKEDYLILEDIIKKLDIPRAMVYIESLIMEVNTEKDFNLGTEWIAMMETSHDGRTAGYGGGFSGSAKYGNLSGLAGGTTGVGSLPEGFSLGTFSEVISIGGVQFSNLAAMIQAFKKDKYVHILSTPQVLTTDNQEASITVGKNVPFQTRSAAENASETYSSYEYKDVGITLKLTPQISKDRMVRLNIFQEVTKLDELATTSSDRPTTLKRTIETTVLVKDGNTIVIGGLIDDSMSNTEYKVPCLGDIPGAGMAFKSASKSGEKTNLYVFLTPRVIQSPEEAGEIYQDKKEDIEKIEEGSIKLYNKSAGHAPTILPKGKKPEE